MEINAFWGAGGCGVGGRRLRRKAVDWPSSEDEGANVCDSTGLLTI